MQICLPITDWWSILSDIVLLILHRQFSFKVFSREQIFSASMSFRPNCTRPSSFSIASDNSSKGSALILSPARCLAEASWRMSSTTSSQLALQYIPDRAVFWVRSSKLQSRILTCYFFRALFAHQAVMGQPAAFGGKSRWWLQINGRFSKTQCDDRTGSLHNSSYRGLAT